MAQIKEGQVTIEMGEGVFYNPRMEMNRDISVACVACLPAVKTYVDAMAASGIRGIRVKKEVPRDMDVTVNDWDAGAFELIGQNAALNEVAVNASNRGANTLLSCTQFDYVDLDPFGTPAPYIDSTCRSAKVAMACHGHGYRTALRRPPARGDAALCRHGPSRPSTTMRSGCEYCWARWRGSRRSTIRPCARCSATPPSITCACISRCSMASSYADADGGPAGLSSPLFQVS